MAYPKIFQPWTSELGRAKSVSDGLELIDLPYMRAERPGFTVFKQGQFRKIKFKQQPPPPARLIQLWGDYVSSSTLYTASFRPKAAAKTERPRGSVITSSTYTLPSSFLVGAGRNRILRIASDTGLTAFWPVLVTTAHDNETAPSAGNVGSVSFHGSMKLEGGASINQFTRTPAAAPTGWNATGFSFTFGGIWRNATSTPITASGGASAGFSVTTNFTSELRTWSTRDDTYPIWNATHTHAGREVAPARVQAEGPGEPVALQFTYDQIDAVVWDGTNYVGTWKPYIKPRLVRSTDHGQNWTYEDATFIEPYLLYETGTSRTGVNVANLHNRDTLDRANLTNMATGAQFIYTGAGTTLLIVPFCHVGGGALRTLLFRNTGSGYVNIPWPADSYNGISSSVGSFNGMFYNSPRSFGLGHAYVCVTVSGVRKFLVTEDHGSTWAEVNQPTDVSIQFSDTVLATPIGGRRAIIAKPTTSPSQIEFFSVTSGMAFTSLGSVAVTSLALDGAGYANHAFFLENSLYVNPAFQGDFDA